LFFASLLFSNLLAQDASPKSRAELSQFQETSSHADVVRFLTEVARQNDTFYVTNSGKSAEGRMIPLGIVAKPMVKTADEAKKSGKLVIYIQANIHAGEVEGKEATLHLLRKFVKDKNLLSKAILLVNPIYNGDGNDRFGPQARHRPGQNGPESVGLRPNGQGLDLNRDCAKVESPEMTGALQHIYSWNPHVVFDLHTTDGTRHGYPLTYGGPGHPNTAKSLQDYAFGEFFPSIRGEAKKRFNLELMDYGNGVFEKEKWRFETFAGDARFVTNYGGLRHALTILSEAIVYDPFQTRIQNTERFVELCLEKILRDASRLKKIQQESIREAVQWKPGKLLGTRFALQKRGVESILLEKDLAKGGRRSGPVTDLEAIMMPVSDRFKVIRYENVPWAYLVPSSESKTIDLLRRHGIVLDLVSSVKQCEEFKVSKFTQEKNAFQGHKLITLEGNWEPSTKVEGGYLVRTGQLLGKVAFDLLEPSAQDGATTWGALGESFPVGSVHPVRRLMSPK
jgi:hypothetical protein